MLRAGFATLAIAALTPAALAQDALDAACDDFLKELEACLRKMPDYERDISKKIPRPIEVRARSRPQTPS